MAPSQDESVLPNELPLMTILTKDRHPATGPDSYYALDQAVLAGFVVPGVDLPHGQRKIAAARLRARMIAVDSWLETGERPSNRVLAERLGMSERCLSYQFESQSALYAFPPPELALSMSAACAGITAWSEIARLVGPLFVALDANPQGRMLLSGLVRLHRSHPALADMDGYFAHALRNAISGKCQRCTLSIIGLFTDGFRVVLEDWVDLGEPSLLFVSDCVGRLIVGPVRSAFDALRELPEPHV
jgi:hypothetical protein